MQSVVSWRSVGYAEVEAPVSPFAHAVRVKRKTIRLLGKYGIICSLKSLIPPILLHGVSGLDIRGALCVCDTDKSPIATFGDDGAENT